MNERGLSTGGNASYWKPSSEGRLQRGINRPRNYESGSNSSGSSVAIHRRQILYSVEHYSVVAIVVSAGAVERGGVDGRRSVNDEIAHFLVQGGWTANDFCLGISHPTLHPQLRQTSFAELKRQRLLDIQQHQQSSDHPNYYNDSSQREPDHDDDHDRQNIHHLCDKDWVRQILTMDPLLSRYSVLLVNGVHDRTLSTDTLLAVLHKILHRSRSDLRLILMCATTESATNALRYLVGEQQQRQESVGAFKREKPREEMGTIITIDGQKTVPVDVLYLSQPAADYVVSTVETVWNILYGPNQQREDGDILCFLPSSTDIERAVRLAEEYFDQQLLLQKKRQSKSDSAFPCDFISLHENLPYSLLGTTLDMLQETVPLPSIPHHLSGNNNRQRLPRAIFTTPMAETAVTLSNIKYVVDSGLVSLPYFDSESGIDRVFTGPISQSSALQRAFCAGRSHQAMVGNGVPTQNQHGTCYRLYSEQFLLKSMESSTPPDIHRTNLTSFLLTLKAIGVDNILAFDLMDMPSMAAIRHGLETLHALGAIDDKTRLTKIGLDMTNFPVEPCIARMLLESVKEGCSWEILAVASVLHVRRDLFRVPRGSGGIVKQQQMLDFEEVLSEVADRNGDHVTFANLFAEADDHGGWNASVCNEKFVNYHVLQQGMTMRRLLAKKFHQVGAIQAFRFHASCTGEDHTVARSQAIRRCVTAGFFANAAKLGNDGLYYTLRKRIRVTPSSSSIITTYSHISGEYIVFGYTAESVQVGEGSLECRFVSSIEAKWLRDLAPQFWE